MLNKIALPMVVAAGLLSIVAASPPKPAELETMSDADINKLNPEQLNALPFIGVMTKLFRAQSPSKPVTTISQAVVMLIEISLYDLRYYPRAPRGEENMELTEAIKEFQKSIGVPATGILFYGEYEKLLANVEFVKRTDILPLGFGSDDKPAVTAVLDRMVVANGTWRIRGDKIAWPVNVSEITCTRSDSVCREAVARVSQSNFSPTDPMSLYVEVNTYKITRWSATEVVAETDGACRSLMLTIDISARDVHQISRNRPGAACVGGIMPLEQPRIAVLMGSLKVGMEYNRQRKDEANAMYAPAYRNIQRSIADTLFK